MSTTLEIKNRIVTNIVAEVQAIDPSFQTDPLKKSVENAVAAALAPEFKLIEILNKIVARQGNPLQCDSIEDSAFGTLEAWARIKLDRGKNQATGGTYDLTVTGNGTVSAGVQYVNQVTGFVYLVQADTVITGSGTVEVKSVGTGSDVSLDVGTELFSVRTITGIDNPATVASETTAPTDGESNEELKDTVVQAFRITPRGGARGDYVVWSDEVAGVRQGYPYSGNALNHVTLYIQSESDPQGVTPSALLTAVETYINGVDPMTAGTLVVISTIPREYNVEVVNLSDASKQTTIETIIDNYFINKRPFVDGVDLQSERKDKIINSEVYAAVQNAILPATFDSLQLSYSGSDVDFEFLPEGTIPKTGTITYS